MLKQRRDYCICCLFVNNHFITGARVCCFAKFRLHKRSYIYIWFIQIYKTLILQPRDSDSVDIDFVLLLYNFYYIF